MQDSPLVSPSVFGMDQLAVVENQTGQWTRKIALMKYATGDILFLSGVVDGNGNVADFDMKKVDSLESVMELLAGEGGAIKQTVSFLNAGRDAFRTDPAPEEEFPHSTD